MAPVKISHVVSFSSQDPRYPVENLLNPDSPRRPWLSCPQDKSGQLKVELQLERAVPIGYIDVGNCGCAFLQIDVGRSSWPLDRPFVTLLPATMLMSLTDSKQGKNRSRVRMFKDVDFLAPASGESWDRLRLTCSQPFTRHQSFGLAFLRVRSSLDSLDVPVEGPSALVSSVLNQGSSDAQESGPSPWLANPSIRRTFFPHPHADTKEISDLRNILTQLQPGTLGRSAHMVLSAARRVPPASVASPKNSHAEPGPSHPGRAGLYPTLILGQTGRRQQEQGKENNTNRRPKAVVARIADSAPFVQAPSGLRFFPGTLPLAERPPHLTQLLPHPHHHRPSLYCGYPPQRIHPLSPGFSALSASCISQQEK
ncbi:putative short transient receptor potential channel 2-like protein isoform X2 [Sapajus apella]|uniref:Short transient receptor potential channel 2-like protein isoform X2 n=1 Tax=Sapajus apella TaxID=9515 RepID=A0A6J3G9W0_SAPAP|nr:putative short transient receptor potential channel 2-like protein isoform X2 [Sapajus apella]